MRWKLLKSKKRVRTDRTVNDFQEEIFIDKKAKPFLVLDIGASSVKALICFSFSKKGLADGLITVAGAGLEYFAQKDVFDSGKFQIEEIKKTVLKAFDNALHNFSFSLVPKDFKKRVQKQKNWEILLGLAPNILKARVVDQFFLRDNPKFKISKREERKICNNIFELAKRDISRKIAKEPGILPNDLYWTSLKIIGSKIEGYPIPKLAGYQGKKIEFKVLISFLPKYYLKNIQRILEPLHFKKFNIVHLAEVMTKMCQRGKKNGVFFDIGADITQIFEVKNSQVKWINEFKKGAEDFVESLSETLGIDSSTARSLIKRYSEKSLTSETTERIKELFLWEKKDWSDKLKSRLEKENLERIFSSNIFLLGGGSSVLEIQRVLEESGSGGIELVSLKDFENIKDVSRSADKPQYMPALLICCVV